jgi:hypothetical protein
MVIKTGLDRGVLMADVLIALANALTRAGLNGAAFAREINLRLAVRGMHDRTIHSTTPYKWIRNGFMPYDPLPSIAADVLSEFLGTPVAIIDLWPRHSRVTHATLTAVLGLDRIVTVNDVLRALSELAAMGAGGGDPIDPSDGFDLLAAVQEGHSVLEEWNRKPDRERVLPPQVDLIAVHIAALRRQDDQHGGGILSLRYVTSELRGILDLVQYADCEPGVRHRLMMIVSDLAQLVGWVHFDAGRYGAAERYLLFSQRIANGIDEFGRAANAMGMLAYVSAFAGHGERAIQIAHAAHRICPDDPMLQARTAGRIATASAAAGDLSAFRAATEKAQRLLSERRNDGTPSYLYYMEPEQLVAEQGQGLVALAKHATTYQRPLLEEAAGLLAPISQADARPEYPRSALLHTCFLTEAHLLRNENEAAVDTARAALARLPVVQSIRGRSYLRRLGLAFASRKRAKAVAPFLPEFDEALSHP